MDEGVLITWDGVCLRVCSADVDQARVNSQGKNRE